MIQLSGCKEPINAQRWLEAWIEVSRSDIDKTGPVEQRSGGTLDNKAHHSISADLKLTAELKMTFYEKRLSIVDAQLFDF